jgi:hypothetical protein
MNLNLDVYLYKYNCPRWYGNVSGLRNIVVDNTILKTVSEDKILEIAKHNSNKYTGSKTCDVYLLQKFNTSIRPVKSYSSLSTIPFTLSSNFKEGEISKNTLTSPIE